MTEQIYNESYYRNYDIGIGSPVNYAENEQLNSFFKNLAKKIVEKFNPETVLDTGCALGLLVKELRALGVSAYGIDVSEYAVLNSVPEARPFCRVCSITEEFPNAFPRTFDLITNIEVMEHLSEDQCGAAIKNICAHTDTVLFSSTSMGFDEPTHINVQSVPYWAKRFAENGFYNVINNYPDYISSDAYCFERCDVSNAVERYEIALCNEKREKETAVSEKQANEEKYSFEVKRLSYLNEQLDRKINDEKSKRIKAESDYKKAVEDLNAVTKLYYEIIHSQYWRITKPFRKITNSIKVFLKKWKVTRYPLRALKILILSGPSVLFKTIRKYRECAKLTSAKIDYTAISAEKRRREEAAVFPKDIKFSILVPLYNTPIKFLDEMIESVKAQTYKNWELCLADGSDNEHTEVGERAKEYSAADKRIVYRKLEKNLGISENTNACIDMSTGDYIALFDHDDILHPSALYENMKAICENGADFIYSDEATFESPNIKKIVSFHFKPDYAVDNLRGVNYICHFTVFSRELLKKTGGFRDKFDGSQDHDLILRLTANANKVYHIRKLLYFWRSHPQSVAMSMGAKNYAIEAGKKAVAESIRNSGYECTVESSKVHPTMYRIKYELKIHPKVSIIIPNMNHKSDLKRCIDSIVFNSTYDNYEIIIIENNSTEKEIFDYYSEIEKQKNIKIVKYEGVFNYSDINNFGAKSASGEYMILLNNDTEIITNEWVEEMLMYAQRPEVGIVGVKLYYPDDTVQHGGVIVGLGGVAGHSHCRLERDDPGYMGKMFYSQDLSAVTAACLMIRKSIFDSIGGFDCEFAVAFNDIDLCLRVRELNKLIVFTPYAELYHYESKSRGYEDTPAKQKRFAGEIELFHKKWDKKFLSKGDPYYNPNLSLETDYEVLYNKVYTECVK